MLASDANNQWLRSKPMTNLLRYLYPTTTHKKSVQLTGINRYQRKYIPKLIANKTITWQSFLQHLATWCKHTAIQMVHEKLTHYSILILFLPHTEKGCLQDLENRTANQNENGSRMLKGMTGILCPKKPPSHPNLFSTFFNLFQLFSIVRFSSSLQKTDWKTQYFVECVSVGFLPDCGWLCGILCTFLISFGARYQSVLILKAWVELVTWLVVEVRVTSLERWSESLSRETDYENL